VLYAFGFDRVGVVVSDLYFLDPNQKPGQEGAEHGVRLEVRLLERQELNGSVYSAQPIGIGQPVWRADLLERVESEPGSHDRTHHHPNFAGWEPGGRVFEPALSADPVTFVGEQLADLDLLLKGAGLGTSDGAGDDADALRAALPEILDTTRRLLDRVNRGELGRAPADAADLVSARIGWL
jgi:hypothetical protein